MQTIRHKSLPLYYIANTQREQGKLTESLANIETALKIIEDLRTQIDSQQLRTSYFASVQDYYSLKIDLLMQLHQKDPSKGYDAEAFDTSERSRARSLLELLAEATSDIRSGVDSKLVEAERNLQLKLDTLEQRRIELYSSNYTPEQASQIALEQQQLLSQYQDLQTEIRTASPRYAALTQPEPLTLQQVQQQVLDDDTLLLQYSLGNERSYLWAVSSTSITSYELPPRAEIEKAAQMFTTAITAPTQRNIPSRISQSADALSQIILQPVADQLENKRLVIVGDGILQSLPFSVLAVPQSTQQNDRFIPLMIEHEIVNLPSASTLAVLRRDLAGRKVASQTIAIFADPVFSKDDERVRGVTIPADGGVTPSLENVPIVNLQLQRSTRELGITLNRLPGTRLEAETIMAMVPESQRTQFFDFQVNKPTAISPDLAKYQIVHFATHGILNTTNPELSGVVMSLVDEKGMSQNGFLRLNDIFNLNLPAELVVLSACQTGVGKEVKGEGIIGLTRGFMYAGVPRVVVSLWNVDDIATSEFMKRFYRGLLEEKLTPAAALRQAQMEMSQIPQWSSPYYWAAFVIQGEWQ